MYQQHDNLIWICVCIICIFNYYSFSTFSYVFGNYFYSVLTLGNFFLSPLYKCLWIIVPINLYCTRLFLTHYCQRGIYLSRPSAIEMAISTHHWKEYSKYVSSLFFFFSIYLFHGAGVNYVVISPSISCDWYVWHCVLTTKYPWKSLPICQVKAQTYSKRSTHK